MESKGLMRYQKVVLLLVSVLLLFAGLNKIEINIMEARNFTAAREMVQSKEYLLTTLNGEPRYQKPPLPTWLTAASASIFGFNSLYSLRLPVVLITLLLVFTFFCFSKLIGFGNTQSFNNGLILITTFYIFFAGRDNQWDMYTHSFMMVSIYFLWKLLTDDRHQLRDSTMAAVFWGLSFLSKGPISFYALLAPFLISYQLVYRIPFKKKGYYLLYWLLGGLALGVSWLVYVHIKDPEYFRIIATRETSNWGTYAVKPFYYYWSFFAQSGLWTIPSLIALFYPYMRNRVANPKLYKLAVLWTLLSVVLLSLVPEKKVRYLVPALIPLALTVGFYVEYIFRNFSSNMQRYERVLVHISYGIIALIGILFPVVVAYILKDEIGKYLFRLIFSSLLIYGCTFTVVNGLIKRNFARIFYSTVALFVIVVVALLPISSDVFKNPAYTPARAALAIEKQYGIKTYSFCDVPPEIVWDFGKPIPVINRGGDGIKLPDEGKFGLLNEGDSTALINQLSGYEVKRVFRIDMNVRDKHSNRKIKDYFLVTRKE